MKKILMLMLAICMVLSFVACGTSSEDSDKNVESIVETENREEQEKTVEETPAHETTITETEPVLEYFETDVIVNDFFVNYNEIAINTINAELVEKSNIRTKALVYADNFSLEVINVSNEKLSISIGAKPEDESITMYEVFCDCIRATTSMSDDEIANAWNYIHESGYMVEDYELKGVLITYVPSKELSWGVNDPRVDLTIPVE